jgi:hypothetical protein
VRKGPIRTVRIGAFPIRRDFATLRKVLFTIRLLALLDFEDGSADAVYQV